MLRTMMTSKIHRATVTQADLHYVGSVTVDADLLDAAGLLEGEQVTIVDIDNGARLVTYAIAGPRGTGCGAGACHVFLLHHCPNQMTCMRCSMTTTVGPTTASTRLDQRVLSVTAHATAITGTSSAVTT